MKAIIMSHKDGKTYVMNKNGEFTVAFGYVHLPVGTEIDLAKKSNVTYLQYAAVAMVFALMVALGLNGRQSPVSEPPYDDTPSYVAADESSVTVIEDPAAPLSEEPTGSSDPKMAALCVAGALVVAGGCWASFRKKDKKSRHSDDP